MLDKLHTHLHQSAFFHRFTAFTRILLAIGFIPPGLTKVLGKPFTSLPTTTSVGYFFDAFFQATEYYMFVGAAQMLAGLLLLFPWTATLGAMIYFPVILNIAIITYAIGFKGTWAITILMTLACLYLLLWDYDRIKSILPAFQKSGSCFTRKEYIYQASFWGILGVGFYSLLFLAEISNIWSKFGITGFVVAAAAGGAFGIIVAWHVTRMRTESEKSQIISSN